MMVLLTLQKQPNANRITDFRRHFLQQDFLDDLSLKCPVFVTNAEAEHFEAFQKQTIGVIEKTAVVRRQSSDTRRHEV